MQNLFLVIASSFGGLAVFFGAFGAHYLKRILSDDMLQVFETGVRYQMYHAFALFAVALLMDRFSGLVYSGSAFVLGTFIFSGSLYFLSLSGIKWIGAITPIGGTLLIVGWVLLLVSILRGSFQ